ncbi:xanthine dehydrogenase family protein subunit M [Mucilaginibacter sp. Bleaf8]|uniref:FAD binding domain-containing protein n=1 Tax=Mucilaginibacter sp. Bleaf8 TaxID=2834430 RepID=UPI001BD0DFFB|nr:xanthine dehydrogenase family protein subunit M [Mucilaginibacter sp. Bleaf8]MBS7566221.1 xanthine dehydrogenase family protein subunit M [Mucilaginibacter sp. Bleaf8]
MNRFTFASVTDISTAIAELDEHDTPKYIAGGTNLLDLMKVNVEKPDHLIDISNLAFNQLEELPDGGLRLGALITNAETAWNKQVKTRYPLLSKAILSGASAQLRNMATNGGNLLQRTRCYYFYDTATPCNKREPGSGCSAIKGYNRIHAILGASEDCIATHPSDMCVALAALDAVVNVTGRDGDRSIPFANFHRLPGDRPDLDNTLGAGEIITSVDLPPNNFAQHFEYLKVRDRASYAFALVSVAVALEMDGNIMTKARIALGGVAHKPWRNTEAENLLTNQVAVMENFKKVADAITKDALGYGDNSFKIELAKRAVIRALMQAAGLEVQS